MARGRVVNRRDIGRVKMVWTSHETVSSWGQNAFDRCPDVRFRHFRVLILSNHDAPTLVPDIYILGKLFAMVY